MSFKKEKVLNYTAFFEAQPEGGFTVSVPALPGCISEGDNLVEAREMIADAIKVTVETPKEEVYKAMNKYNLMALPVIDLKGKIVGVIFADDVISRMIPDSLRKQRVKIRGQYKKRKRYEKPDKREHQNGMRLNKDSSNGSVSQSK